MEANIVKICVVCKTEKSIENFYNKFSGCKACNIKRVLKRHYNNKNKLLQQRRDICAHFKDFDNRLGTLEEKLSVKKNYHKQPKNQLIFL